VPSVGDLENASLCVVQQKDLAIAVGVVSAVSFFFG
jgi:hypothetical protein